MNYSTPKFNTGDEVTWESTRARRGQTFKGVVTKWNRDKKRPRYTVQTAEGPFTVPEMMLKPAAVKDIHTKIDLIDEGREYLAKRQANVDSRRDARARQFAGRLEDLAVGERVKVYQDGFGWQETRITAIHLDSGRVTVDNPKAVLVYAFGDLPNGRKVKDTITVLANRIRKMS